MVVLHNIAQMPEQGVNCSGDFFPLRNLIRVDAVVGGDFVNRALPLNRLKSDLHLEGGGVGFSLLLFHRITMISSDFTP